MSRETLRQALHGNLNGGLLRVSYSYAASSAVDRELPRIKEGGKERAGGRDGKTWRPL